MVRSLKAQGVAPVFHMHRLNPANIEAVRQAREDDSSSEEHEAAWINQHIIQKQRPVKFISLVREPVGRNVSAFFQNLEAITGLDKEAVLCNADKLQAYFLNSYKHSVPLDWFDVEVQETLGIEVYAQPFPKEKGYIEFQNGPFELLVLRAELPDGEKAEAIQRFLGLRRFEIGRENVSARKWYADLYDHFKQHLALPQEHLDAMCTAKYTRHFYTASEIEAMRVRWTPSNNDKSARQA